MSLFEHEQVVFIQYKGGVEGGPSRYAGDPGWHPNMARAQGQLGKVNYSGPRTTGVRMTYGDHWSFLTEDVFPFTNNDPLWVHLYMDNLSA